MTRRRKKIGSVNSSMKIAIMNILMTFRTDLPGLQRSNCVHQLVLVPVLHSLQYKMNLHCTTNHNTYFNRKLSDESCPAYDKTTWPAATRSGNLSTGERNSRELKIRGYR